MAQPALRFAYVLARDLGITVQELGARMSAQEFAHWRVMYSREQWHPLVGQMRHAQLLAATYQGPSTRKGKRAWSAADFMGADPWAPAPEPRRLKGAEVIAWVRGMQSRRLH